MEAQNRIPTSQQQQQVQETQTEGWIKGFEEEHGKEPERASEVKCNFYLGSEMIKGQRCSFSYFLQPGNGGLRSSLQCVSWHGPNCISWSQWKFTLFNISYCFCNCCHQSAITNRKP